jgi:hypothetical protein
MDLNICNLNICLVIPRYHIFVLVLRIHISHFRGHDTLPLHGKPCSAIDEQTETGPKDSTYNSLECEVDKKGSEVRSQNLDTIHAKNCLHRGM